jgi:hypothetical protein
LSIKNLLIEKKNILINAGEMKQKKKEVKGKEDGQNHTKTEDRSRRRKRSIKKHCKEYFDLNSLVIVFKK